MKIAILMPYRNSEKTVLASLESVKNQTYKNYELIAVDNSSSDNSRKIVAEYCSLNEIPAVHLSNADGCFSSVLNKGLFYILGNGGFDAVARLDSDDIWMPNKLQKQVDFLLLNPDTSLVGTQIENFSDEFQCSAALPYPTTDKDIKEMLYSNRNAIAHPSVMIRICVYYRCGVYDEIYRHCEDYQYWMKVSRHFKLANLDEILVKYRVHETSNYNPVIPLACRAYYGRAIKESFFKA